MDNPVSSILMQMLQVSLLFRRLRPETLAWFVKIPSANGKKTFPNPQHRYDWFDT